MFRGNMGGFGGNMQNMIRQAQKMQEEMQNKMKDADDKLKNTTLSANIGGGAVTVEITGDKRITSVKIDPKVVDPDDVEMLEDMIMSCVNEAIVKANALEQELKGDMGGLGGLM